MPVIGNIRYTLPEIDGKKICCSCGREQLSDDYTEKRRSVTGRSSKCKFCEREYMKMMRKKIRNLGELADRRLREWHGKRRGCGDVIIPSQGKSKLP
jgi:hypothetical protein